MVAVSSYTRSQLYRWAELQYWPKVQVVHCGLDAAYFTGPVIARTAGTAPALRGSNMRSKRGSYFWSKLRTDLGRRAWISSWCWRATERCAALSRRSLHVNNLQARVRITGWISSEQVRDEILAARALVLPSFAEGLPVVIMEAMALRRPVISTFVAGIPELVQPGEHGWLVPAGDVEALARVMQDCLDAPTDVLMRMGNAAHKRVLARHCVDKQAAQLVKFFNAAVEGRRDFSNSGRPEPSECSNAKPIAPGISI